MLKMLAGKLLGGGLSTVADSAVKVAGIFGKNKEAQAVRDAAALARSDDIVTSAQMQFAQEFHTPTNWFDSLINGLNRLPRPVIALSVIGLLYYACIDPIGFAAAMKALELVPPNLWWIVSGVILFYFGARTIEKRSRDKVQLAVTEAKTKSVLEGIRSLKELKRAEQEMSFKHSDNSVNQLVDEEDEEDSDENPAVDTIVRNKKQKVDDIYGKKCTY